MNLRSFFICFACACLGALQAQVNEGADPQEKPVKDLFFRKNMSLRNAWIKARYYIDRTPEPLTDSALRAKGWILSFHDDFDSLDTKKWRVGQAWGEMHPDNPHQYYAASEVSVRNGCLYLGGTYKPKQIRYRDSTLTVPYAIGLVNTDISFTQKYGYFEIRSKNPSGPATWPAFWLTAANKWPPEIDIFEMYGGRSGGNVHNQSVSVHWGQNNTRSMGFLSKTIRLPEDTDTIFHTYGCEWTPEHIRFYTDGRLVTHISVNKELRKWLDEEMVIVINNCFERQYLAFLPEGFTGNQFVVDWIRVYRMPK